MVRERLAEAGSPPAAIELRSLGDGKWFVELDLQRLKGVIEAIGLEAPGADMHLARWREFQRWGFRAQAHDEAVLARNAISTESEDTLVAGDEEAQEGALADLLTLMLVNARLGDIKEAVAEGRLSSRQARAKVERLASLLSSGTSLKSKLILRPLSVRCEEIENIDKLPASERAKWAEATQRLQERFRHKELLLVGTDAVDDDYIDEPNDQVAPPDPTTAPDRTRTPAEEKPPD